MDRTEQSQKGSYYDSGDPLSIRFATRDDLNALEWDGEYTHYRRLFERAIEEARRGRRILLLAEIEGQLVGQLFVQLSPRAKSSTASISSGYMYAFRVKTPYRNQGVGSQLIHEAEQNLSNRGYIRAVITVEKRNVAARRLYERAGYAVVRENSGEWSYIDHEGKLQEVREPAFVLEKWL